MNIREKIKKLLALGASPNENEAKAALLKAKKLMAENKLSEADFAEKSKMVSVTVEDIKWTTDSGEIWKANLAKLIAEEHLCVSAWRTKHGTRTHTLVLTGMEQDVEVAKEILLFAVGFCENNIRKYSRMYKVDMKKAGQSYANGFIAGLDVAYSMQRDEHEEWGLVMVTPKEVSEYKDNLASKGVKVKQSSTDPLIHMKGYKDGVEFNQRKVLK